MVGSSFLNVWTYQQVEEAVAADWSLGEDLQVAGDRTRRQVPVIEESEDPFDDLLAESKRVEDNGGHEAVQQAPAWDNPFVGLWYQHRSALVQTEKDLEPFDQLTLVTTTTLSAP